MKIAFCLMGIVGSAADKYGIGSPIDYRIGHYFHKKNIFDHNDVDVFIHSWSVDFKQGLVNVYNPKSYLIEPQIDFGFNMIRAESLKSRWYSTKKVLELKTQYEQENNFEYDFVMVDRLDDIHNSPIKFSEFDNSYFYNSHVHECYGGSCRCQDIGMSADLWFFGNSKDMDLFGTLYDKLDEYKIGHPHKDMFYHLQQTGLQKRQKHIFYDRYDHYPARCKYINTEYVEGEFDITKLKEFESIDIGYGKRTHTPDDVLVRGAKKQTNIVFMPVISTGDGRNSSYQYSVKSWKHWCDKNNCELFVMEDLIHPIEQMKITWQRYYLFDILESNDIEYDKILMADADIIIHPDCPNFFDGLDKEKYYGVAVDGCYEWLNRSIDNYHEYLFSDQDRLNCWEYINGGFQIVNDYHKSFFNKVIDFYWKHSEELIYAQNEFKVGTDQTPINYLLRRHNIDVELLPLRYNLQDMQRKNLLHFPDHSHWPDDLSNLYKSGYVYHFNAIPYHKSNRDAKYWMKRVFQDLYEK